MNTSIVLKNISKSFPGVRALDNVSFSFSTGKVHALLGENGAGKSTLIKILSGAYTQFEGTIEIDGVPVSFKHPKDSIAKGISVIYQELNLCGNINIAENIFLGDLPAKRTGALDSSELMKNTQRLLDLVHLPLSPTVKVSQLSTAQQQLVEIAKALSHNSRLLVMDEPTSALSPQEVENLFVLIRQLKTEGVGVIFVSHKLEEIFKISDDVSILRDGKLVGTYETSKVDKDTLISLMVGRSVNSRIIRQRSVKSKEMVLEVEGLANEYLKDISFQVRAGEIVGFAGLMGAGRTELAKAVFGFDPISSGSVRLGGVPVPSSNTAAACKLGIGFVPEDRKKEGLFHYLSVLKNISISSLSAYSSTIHIHKERELSVVRSIVSSLSIKTPSLQQLVEKLSGGNQQKVILSRWLIKKNLKLLIVDEPTRGIDVGAKQEIYMILDKLAAQGLAIMIMSSEMPEILNLSDRIYVMSQGKITGELDYHEATQEKIIELAI
jgi:ABC-type sugar transport system ATPase subunit